MRYIEVKTQFEGFHKYKNAPKEVEFLRSTHRHIFVVRTKIEVLDLDRELEFFYFQSKINKLIKEYQKKNLNNLGSCEIIADFILDWLEEGHPSRRIEVGVWEDDENGGVVNNYDSFK